MQQIKWALLGFGIAIGTNVYGRVPREYVLDEIIETLYHPEGTEIILLSDTTTGLEGKERSLHDLELETLTYLDAKKLKGIVVSEDDIDRFIAQLQKQNNWTRADIEDFFKEHGYSFEEGRDLIRRKQMVNQMIDYKVRSDKAMAVSLDEAQAIYDQHPREEEATYTLAIGFAPSNLYTLAQLNKAVEKNMPLEKIEWDEPFVRKESDLPKDRKFIAKRSVGHVVLVEPVEGGFELTKLVEKTPKRQIPFDECSAEIINKIRQERFESVLKKYENELEADPVVYKEKYTKK